jgi:hypothetical protein
LPRGICFTDRAGQRSHLILRPVTGSLRPTEVATAAVTTSAGRTECPGASSLALRPSRKSSCRACYGRSAITSRPRITFHNGE